MERGDSVLHIQTHIRRVLHGKNHPEHHKRTHSESVHLQHAHKPVNWRTGKTNGKETNQKNKGNKDDKTSRTLITPQSKVDVLFMINEEELPVSAMHRIIKKAGAERVSESGAKELARVLEEIGLKIGKDALEFSMYAGRKQSKEKTLRSRQRNS